MLFADRTGLPQVSEEQGSCSNNCWVPRGKSHRVKYSCLAPNDRLRLSSFLSGCEAHRLSAEKNKLSLGPQLRFGEVFKPNATINPRRRTGFESQLKQSAPIPSLQYCVCFQKQRSCCQLLFFWSLVIRTCFRDQLSQLFVLCCGLCGSHRVVPLGSNGWL